MLLPYAFLMYLHGVGWLVSQLVGKPAVGVSWLVGQRWGTVSWLVSGQWLFDSGQLVGWWTVGWLVGGQLVGL